MTQHQHNHQQGEEDSDEGLFTRIKGNIMGRTSESWAFVLLAVIVQCVFLVLFYIFTDYNHFATPDEASEHIARYYKMELDVAGMVFVGFGFLMTFLKKYGYSSFGLNFMIAVLAIQWGVLTMGFFHAITEKFSHNIRMDVTWLVEGNFAAATVLISFGAVLGKISPAQLVIMMLSELIFYSLNFYIGYMTLHATDAGGSMYIHSFGAYFGLAVSMFMTRNEARENPNQGAKYNSDLFSLIGTIFLWLFWPSFNGALTTPQGKARVIVNTFMSLVGSASATFIVSRAFRGKWEMEDIQNATIAGGVAMGTCADLIISPAGALTIGLISGIVSSLGYIYLSPLLRKLYLHDTCGVHNLHGMPGVLGALSGIVATGVAVKRKSTYGTEYDDYMQNGKYQPAYQLAALAITIGIALVSGTFTGVILRWFAPPKEFFTDAEYWHLPEDEFLWDSESGLEKPQKLEEEGAKKGEEDSNEDKELVEMTPHDVPTPTSENALKSHDSMVELVDHAK